MDSEVIARYAKAFSWETITQNQTKILVNNLKPVMDNLAFVIYTFDDCNLKEAKIEIAKSLSAQEIVAEMQNACKIIAPNEPCYLFARFPYTIKTRHINKYMFIMWSPDTAHVKEKMKSTSFYVLYFKFFKEHAFKNYAMCDEHITFNDIDDFTFETLEKIVVQGKIPPIENDFSRRLYTNSKSHFEDVILIAH